MSVVRLLVLAAMLSAACGRGAGPRLDCPAGTKPEETEFARGCKRPDGTWHGPFVSVYPGGRPNQTGAFRDGVFDGHWVVQAADGRVLGTFDIVDGNGVVINWHSNGKKSSETTYRAGKVDGPATTWHRNGNKATESVWRDGFVESVTQYDENGAKIDEQQQRYGRRHGLSRTWDPATGALVKEEEYRHGMRLRETVYAQSKVVSTQSWPVPERPGHAVTLSHPSINPAWQACQEDAECELVTLTCCACDAANYAAVNYKHRPDAQKAISLEHCAKTSCPAQMCQPVGTRCEQGRCASAH